MKLLEVNTYVYLHTSRYLKANVREKVRIVQCGKPQETFDQFCELLTARNSTGNYKLNANLLF